LIKIETAMVCLPSGKTIDFRLRLTGSTNVECSPKTLSILRIELNLMSQEAILLRTVSKYGSSTNNVSYSVVY